LCDEHENAIKPSIIQDYNNRYMGHVDKGDRVADSYMIQCQTWKWAKKIIFSFAGLDNSEQLPPPDFMWC
jgi:hypothetical protein